MTKTVFVGIPYFEISCVAEFGNSTAAFFASPTNYSEKWASIPMDYGWSYSDGNQNVVVGYYPNASFADIQTVITFPHSGYYTISMKAILNDCYIPVATMQYYCPPNMRLAYFISPNGDGINDVWEIIDTTKPDIETPKDKNQKTLVYNVTIFNSEGHIVYWKDKYM